MIVYCDVLVTVNTLINFLLLLLGAVLCGYPAKRWRCLCGGLAGGAYALVTAMNPLLGRIGFQAVAYIFMCIVSYGLRKKALRPTVLSFLMAAALAGFVQLAIRIFSVNAVFLDGAIYFPIGAKILVLLAGVFYLAASVVAAGAMRHGGRELKKITLTCAAVRKTVIAFCDTGSTARDPLGGLPVVILEKGAAEELLQIRKDSISLDDPSEAFSQLRKQFPHLQFRLIPYKAVGVSCGLLAAFVCAMERQPGRGKRKILAAISPTAISDGGSYEALIGGDLF